MAFPTPLFPPKRGGGGKKRKYKLKNRKLEATSLGSSWDDIGPNERSSCIEYLGAKYGVHVADMLRDPNQAARGISLTTGQCD